MKIVENTVRCPKWINECDVVRLAAHQVTGQLLQSAWIKDGALMAFYSYYNFGAQMHNEYVPLLRVKLKNAKIYAGSDFWGSVVDEEEF